MKFEKGKKYTITGLFGNNFEVKICDIEQIGEGKSKKTIIHYECVVSRIGQYSLLEFWKVTQKQRKVDGVINSSDEVKRFKKRYLEANKKIKKLDSIDI